MSIGWNFPKNNYGQLTGIGEAGVETFKGSPYGSLAREICQNSLDAQCDKDKSVIVEFQEFTIGSKELFGNEELLDVFKRCERFWRIQKNSKTSNFFNKALDIINSNKISVLRVSDYNTTGLTGSDKDYNTPWQNLVKSSGVSDKEGTSGGSFGIGKSAPFVCSQLRTIFYSTLDNKGIKASQGVARLVSFEDKDGDITQGIGYFGHTEKNSAIRDMISIDKSFKRNISGTDIYILGFNKKDDWEKEIIKAVLDGFLVSILNGKLMVKVSGIGIFRDSLPFIIEQYREETKLAYNYYQVLTSEETQIFEYDIQDLGQALLYVLFQQNLHRKVLIARSNGMKIFDKANISSTVHFAGVLILKDEKVNGYFRDMETPQHNSWEPERHSNPKEAKRTMKELYKYIKYQILEVERNNIADEVDAEGIGDYLPDEVALGGIQNQSDGDKEEVISDKTKDIVITVVERLSIPKGFENIEGKNADDDIEVLGLEDEKGEIEGRIPKGDPNANNGGIGSKGNFKEDEKGNKKITKEVEVKVSYIRFFVVDSVKKKYKLILMAEKSARYGYIQLKLAGEQGNASAKIKDAFLDNDIKTSLKCINDKIYIDNIVARRKTTVSFNLDYSDYCSMEVNIYGYSI